MKKKNDCQEDNPGPLGRTNQGASQYKNEWVNLRDIHVEEEELWRPVIKGL